MIKEKLKLSKDIIEKYPKCKADDGNGHFLNAVVELLYPTGKIDFTEFKPESWTRARRKVLEQNPHLDLRTLKTKDAEAQVKSEMR